MRLEMPVNSNSESREEIIRGAMYTLHSNGGGCICDPPRHVLTARLWLPVKIRPINDSRAPLCMRQKPDIIGISLGPDDGDERDVHVSLGVRFQYKFVGQSVDYVNLRIIGDEGLIVRDGGINEFTTSVLNNPWLTPETILARPTLNVVRNKNGRTVTVSADTIDGRKILTLQHDVKAKIVIFSDNN